MALAVVRGADGAGDWRRVTVVKYTGGSTGTSLAFVCAAMGHPITLVTSDAFAARSGTTCARSAPPSSSFRAKAGARRKSSSSE